MVRRAPDAALKVMRLVFELIAHAVPRELVLAAPGRYVLGRDPSCEIHSTFPPLSKRAAIIEVSAGGGCTIATHRQATSGVWIGERRVDLEPVPFVEGDIASVCGLEVRFVRLD
jgi:hypothetical protein